MGLKCNNCGEETVSWEDSGSGDQQVCRSCGFVYSDCVLVDDPVLSSKKPENQDRYLRDRLPKQYARYQCERKTDIYISGSKLVRSVCCALQLKHALVEQSLQLFDRVYKLYIHTHTDTKHCLAAWCVYIVCRQEGLPIASHYVAQITGYPVHKLYTLHQELLQQLCISLPHQDISTLVDSSLRLELSSSVTCTPQATDKARNILMLCKDLWLLDGRNPHASILAAFYLAWQSQDFSSRRKLPLSKLCKRPSLASLAMKRLAEFRIVLCKLGQCIPWVTEVKPENLPYYVDDILRYQRSLMIDALRKAQGETTDTDLYQGDTLLTQAVKVARGEPQTNHTASSVVQGPSLQPHSASSVIQSPRPDSDKEADSDQCIKTCPICKTGSACCTKCVPSTSTHTQKLSKSEALCDDLTTPTTQTTALNKRLAQTLDRQAEERKESVDCECIFTPPAYKKSRKKSIESETLEAFIDSMRTGKP